MQESEQRLLMLIDDEPAQCRLISALASREGWRTIIARDSESAIATLGTRQGMQLGAIILDQWVPGDDACALIAGGARLPDLLVDQGEADNFLAEQLKTNLLGEACTTAGQKATIRMQPRYDHSYYFISTFMAEHLAWHAERLK